MRAFKSRPIDIGHARCLRLAEWFGRELRLARMTAGLTQIQLAILAGVSQQAVSMAERGDPAISLDIRCRLAAASGHELGWRLYPVASVSLRDSGQLGIARTIAAAHPSWRCELEAAVAPGDARAADLLLHRPEELAHIEIERALIDAQAQLRSSQLKRDLIASHGTLPVRLIIAVPDTSTSRQRLAPFATLLGRTFPVPSREIWRSIRHGEPIGGDGILFVRAVRSGSTSGGRAVHCP